MKSDNSRREFLKKSALTTAGVGMGALAFPASSYSKIMGANDRVNVGIVGFSDRARHALIPAMLVHSPLFRISGAGGETNVRRT